MTTHPLQLAAPFFDEEDIEAVAAVLRSGTLANGPQIGALEADLGALLGGVPAAAVANGSVALFLAGRALGLGAGDTVLVSALTYAASANAFTFAGCRVVPVDVDLETWNISAEDLKRAIGEHGEARAAVVVDLYGSTAGTDQAIGVARDAGLAVVEDASQAHGARCADGSPIGSRADATTFSFYATKNVAAGEGGAVVSPARAMVDRVKVLRNHGSADNEIFTESSLNFRLAEVPAVLARRQLAGLSENNARRRANAGQLAAAFATGWGDRVSVPPAAVQDQGDPSHVFHQFTVRFASTGERDAAQVKFTAAGIQTKVFYPYVLSELPGVTARATPVAEMLRDTILSIPVHPQLTEDALCLVVDVIGEAAKAVTPT